MTYQYIEDTPEAMLKMQVRVLNAYIGQGGEKDIRSIV
jgi:hypothetical protein